MSQDTSLLGATATELDEISERLNEISDWALDMGYDAVQQKIEEGIGRIESAAEAARQYHEGILK